MIDFTSYHVVDKIAKMHKTDNRNKGHDLTSHIISIIYLVETIYILHNTLQYAIVSQ